MLPEINVGEGIEHQQVYGVGQQQVVQINVNAAAPSVHKPEQP